MPTPTEARLRRELDALAPAPPPDLLALAGVGRAAGRRRRRRRAAAVAAAAGVVVAALVGPGFARERRADVVTPVTSPGGPASVPPSAAPAPPVSPPDGTRVTFAGVTLTPPAGWVVAERRGDTSLCLAPAGNPAPHWDDCGGLTLVHGDLPGFENAPYRDHGPWAWYHATDVTPCPTAPEPAPGAPLDGVQGAAPGPDPYAPVDRGFRPVGAHMAVYDRWAARCELSGYTFHPRAWHLPTSQIVIFDVLGRPETEAILASFQFR